MSIKFKLLVQALIPVLCIILFGGGSLLWTTIAQQKNLIKENLDSNILHLENEIKFTVVQMEKTLKKGVLNRDLIRYVRSLYTIKEGFPELKRTVQCKAAILTRDLTFDKGHNMVALYGPAGIESYATEDGVYVTSKKQQAATTEHYTPSAGPFLKQCSSNDWTKIESPENLPENLTEKPNTSFDFSTHFSLANGQLDLIGILPITEAVYADGEEKTIPIGVIYLRKRFSNEFVQEISKKTSINSDLFSLTGEHLVGTHSDQFKLLPLEIKEPLKGELFSEINIKNEDFFMALRPYYIDDKPIFLLAAYSPKGTVTSNIKKIFFLQISGGLIGVIIATFAAFFMARFITRPIKKITEQMNTVSNEKRFDQRVQIDSGDELGALAVSFNKMSSMLEDHDAEVSRYANELSEINKTLEEEREGLERSVAERTRELRISKEIAEKANLAKSEFLARMSHELRTPMNAILGFTQLLEMNAENSLTCLQKENLGRVSSAGYHLLELINEVLDLSRIESGEMTLSIEVVDLVPIVDNVIAILRPLAKENNISLECHNIPDGGCFAKVDILRFKQVVMNLVSNAIKYNKPNGTVVVSYKDRENGMIRVGVRDTGHGIADGKRDKLFKPFERFDRDAETIEGTGIGLTISRKLIELMNGTIGFESKESEGSFFYIDVPVSIKAPAPQIEEKAERAQRSEKNNKKKILYIEDIPANMELVKQILKSRPQLDLLWAPNAMDGIESAQADAPDLILMDIHLPEMDGLTAFQKLQTIEETKNIPVIALTADAMDADIKMALDMGFKDYITKPIDVVKFLELTDQVLA